MQKLCSKWRFSGDTDLILLNTKYDAKTNCAIIDFENAEPFDFEKMKTDGTLLTVGRFFERIFQYCEDHFGQSGTIGAGAGANVGNAKHLKETLNIRFPSGSTEIQNATDRLDALLKASVPKLTALNSATQANITQAKAVIKEASEAFRPLHEFYRDPRLRKARVDAINAGLPELFVDTIAGKMHMGEKFPTTDILHRYLSNPLLAKKLGAAEGKLFSRATIGRWLTEFKMILQRRGFPIPKYRVRNTMLKDNPSEPSEGFAGDGENPQDEDEKGKTKPDTRDQELPEGADNSD